MSIWQPPLVAVNGNLAAAKVTSNPVWPHITRLWSPQFVPRYVGRLSAERTIIRKQWYTVKRVELAAGDGKKNWPIALAKTQFFLAD